MGQFRGKDGRVYALGQPHAFSGVPLRDCGEGWDWQAPEDMRCWLPEDLRFDIQGDSAGVVEIHHYSGRVCFGRCISSAEVFSSGTCRTTSLLSEGSPWELFTQSVVANSSILGVDAPETKAKTVGAVASLSGTIEPIHNEVLVVLPLVGERAFVGIGDPTVFSDRVQVRFEPERIGYGYR